LYKQSADESVFKSKWVALALVVCLGLVTWFQLRPEPDSNVFHQNAIVILNHPLGKTTVNGIIEFEQLKAKGPVSIRGTINNLDPSSERGFHVHELGDLTDGCTSTGPHFNPLRNPHGAPEDRIRHVGDLGNISTNSSGIAALDFRDDIISLNGQFSIIGRALVVHSGTDDLGKKPNEGSQINGNSGERVACGVIGLKFSK